MNVLQSCTQTHFMKWLLAFLKQQLHKMSLCALFCDKLVLWICCLKIGTHRSMFLGNLTATNCAHTIDSSDDSWSFSLPARAHDIGLLAGLRRTCMGLQFRSIVFSSLRCYTNILWQPSLCCRCLVSLHTINSWTWVSLCLVDEWSCGHDLLQLYLSNESML